MFLKSLSILNKMKFILKQLLEKNRCNLHYRKTQKEGLKPEHPFKNSYSKSSHPGVLLGKDVPKICSKFTEEHPCRSAISIKL